LPTQSLAVIASYLINQVLARASCHFASLRITPSNPVQSNPSKQSSTKEE
jgi:hypothetical protein